MNRRTFLKSIGLLAGFGVAGAKRDENAVLMSQARQSAELRSTLKLPKAIHKRIGPIKGAVEFNDALLVFTPNAIYKCKNGTFEEIRSYVGKEIPANMVQIIAGTA
jgi:hypothetical protein